MAMHGVRREIPDGRLEENRNAGGQGAYLCKDGRAAQMRKVRKALHG